MFVAEINLCEAREENTLTTRETRVFIDGAVEEDNSRTWQHQTITTMTIITISGK